MSKHYQKVGAYCACIYFAPWIDFLAFHWYFLGIGAALFGLWHVRPVLRLVAAIGWGLVGWCLFCDWLNWHPLENDWFVAFVGFFFCAWLHDYIENHQDNDSKEEF